MARAWGSTAPSSSTWTGATSPPRRSTTRTTKLILETLAPHPVTIRTFDLGGDKLPLGVRNHEENPALGLRAVRYCLRHPDMFRTQLRGLLRASVHGNLRIMFPMMSGVAELRAARRALVEANEELRREGVETRAARSGSWWSSHRRR